MPPLTRAIWNQSWTSYNAALQECNHCQLKFTLYDCGCLRMTLPAFDEDPLSKSCRIYPPSEYSSKPKPTTIPKILYERKHSGCGRFNEKDCEWNAKEERQCPYDPLGKQDCERFVDIYKRCTHVKMRFVLCQNEQDRRNRKQPSKHVTHIVGGLVDEFCSSECMDKQRRLDEEQRILEEEQARRRSENRAQERNGSERYLKHGVRYLRSQGTQRPRSDKPSASDGVSTSSTYSGSPNYQYRWYPDAELEKKSRNTTRKYKY
ncbi:hypothetical protein EAE96_003070 [Botrytis aclada]|nr:hypothetical protein EAE96_003070 [Botrytis aclada]